jgi:hypothetical protein
MDARQRKLTRLAGTIHVDMYELEEIFESDDPAYAHYLDTESGKCLTLLIDPSDPALMTDEVEAEIERIETAPAGRYLALEADDVDLRPSMGDAKEFTREVSDDALRQRLTEALALRSGAFRRFLDRLREDRPESDRWDHYRRQRLWTRIASYLASRGVNVRYDPLPPYKRRNVRG